MKYVVRAVTLPFVLVAFVAYWMTWGVGCWLGDQYRDAEEWEAATEWVLVIVSLSIPLFCLGFLPAIMFWVALSIGDPSWRLSWFREHYFPPRPPKPEPPPDPDYIEALAELERELGI